MIISHKEKFVFVHIPKTAGTSITEIFIPYARLIEKISSYYQTRKFITLTNKLFKLEDSGNSWINGIHKHGSAQEIKEYLGSSIWESYFTFAFTRNPYDLELSLYNYIQKSKEHKNNNIALTHSFDDWIEHRLNNYPPLQIDYLKDKEGKMCVDYVGKLESIDHDVRFVCEKLQIPFQGIPHRNKTTASNDASSLILDKTRDKIHSYFFKDFQILGYNP